MKGWIPTVPPLEQDRFAEPSGRRHLPSALRGAGIGAFAVALLLLLGLVIDRYPFDFDRAIITGLRTWGGPRWLSRAAIDVTALGGGTVLTVVVTVVVGFLFAHRLWLTGAATIAAIVSGSYAVDVLKRVVARPRPDLVDHLVPVSSMSFPSGHAASSAVVYLTLVGLATQVVRDRIARRYLIIATVLLVGAIGSSRVYLGVHWPSDVLAGWSFGTMWALGWWWATAKTRASIGGER